MFKISSKISENFLVQNRSDFSLYVFRHTLASRFTAHTSKFCRNLNPSSSASKALPPRPPTAIKFIGHGAEMGERTSCSTRCTARKNNHFVVAITTNSLQISNRGFSANKTETQKVLGRLLGGRPNLPLKKKKKKKKKSGRSISPRDHCVGEARTISYYAA